MLNLFEKNPFGIFQFGTNGEIVIDRSTHDNLMRNLVGEENWQRQQRLKQGRRELYLIQEAVRIQNEKQWLLDRARHVQKMRLIDVTPTHKLRHVLEENGFSV